MHAETTRRILDCAFAVHRDLGPVVLESVYENALARELAARAVRAVASIHLATVLSYLKATGLCVGLILNFAKANLGIKRVVL